MNTRIQYVRSKPVRKLVMVKKGRKMVPATYVTKSGQMKNRYVDDSGSKVVKSIIHTRPHG